MQAVLRIVRHSVRYIGGKNMKKEKMIQCPCAKYHEYLYPIARILIGFMFMLHGAQKFGLMGDGNISGFAGALGLPIWLAFMAAAVELVGGLMVMLGVFSRYAACAGVVVMIVAYIMAHMPNGINPLANKGELALMYLASFLIIHYIGDGKISLGKYLRISC